MHKYDHGEMRKKSWEIEEMTLHKDGSSAVRLGRGRGKKKLVQHGVFVFGHPSKY